jgi:hypothetical protein
LQSVIVALLRDPVTMGLREEYKDAAQERGARVDIFKKVHRGEIPNYALISNYDGNLKIGYRYMDFYEIYTTK